MPGARSRISLIPPTRYGHPPQRKTTEAQHRPDPANPRKCQRVAEPVHHSSLVIKIGTVSVPLSQNFRRNISGSWPACLSCP